MLFNCVSGLKHTKDLLTPRRICGGQLERDVLGAEERPDQLAVDDEFGAVGRLQAVRSRVCDREHAVAPDEDSEQNRGRGVSAKSGSRCYFHFGKMAPDAMERAREREKERWKPEGKTREGNPRVRQKDVS